MGAVPAADEVGNFDIGRQARPLSSVVESAGQRLEHPSHAVEVAM